MLCRHDIITEHARDLQSSASQFWLPEVLRPFMHILAKDSSQNCPYLDFQKNRFRAMILGRFSLLQSPYVDFQKK